MFVTSLLLAGLIQSAPADPQKPKKNPYRTFQVADLATARVKSKGQVFTCWVMDTDAKREEGMMFLKDSDFTMKQAMIFVFSEEEVQRFWMKNTFVNLDIAYIGKDKTIVKTYTMQAFDTVTNYSSLKPAQYVIEFKEGALKKYGIKAGDKVELMDPVKSKD